MKAPCRLLASLLLASPALAVPQVDADLFAGMKARSIGPAGMSGRVAAIEALAADPSLMYVGAATGGLWKTEDGGMSWTPVFDDQPVASIGAVAVYPSAPDIVWVGTGEGNPRNSASVGGGVYKSLDGGRTWKYLGLEGTEKIHRVLLDPRDPDVAFVAALGTTWGENPERGVFKTVDGGRTFERVLHVDERSGCADLVIDPRNPDKLLAAMWDHRREPHSFRSGGPGSGLYLTLDGGAWWKRLDEENGLPAGELGRIGLAIAPSDPDIIYALVEAKKNVLLRSSDGGESWVTVNRETDVSPRPFYYADLRVDPADPNRVYRLASTVTVSNDGGKSFETLIPWSLIHPDHHALWIDPSDPNHIIDGNDGGVAISRDRGASWRFVRNLPLAQYYHLNVDMQVPYNVYGGMQDNGSWRGPSAVWENGGIRNHHWHEVGFGDGFATLPIPGDPTQGYAMSQGGYLMRWDFETGEREFIRPPDPSAADGEGVTAPRFNWNAGIAIDPFDGETVYYGSQFVHRSRDRGDSWDVISPDLTTNDPEKQKQAESGGLTLDVTAAENYTSILTIAPSSLERDVLWVGSDDGRLHVTRDGGGTWTSVEGNVLGVPVGTWIPHVEASKFDAAEAFVVFDDHRRANGATYVYRTRDYGRSWSALATEGVSGYAHVIEQDPVDRDLLFLGTEFGLHVSLDGGRDWMKWTHGLPTVAVRALVVHPREHDLVIGTHGRAAYVLDDVRPLRALGEDARAKPLHLFEIPQAIEYQVKQTSESRFPGSEEFRGTNRPYGALITFWLADSSLPHPDPEKEKARKREERARSAAEPATEEEDPAEEKQNEKKKAGSKAEIEILDTRGRVIRTFERSVTQGLNRVVWNLRRKGFRRPGSEPRAGGDGPRGPRVLPGTYTVVVRFGEHEVRGDVEVLADPRQDFDAADRAAKFDALMRAGRLNETLANALERIERTRRDVDLVEAKADEDKPDGANEDEEHPHRELLDSASELEKSLTKLEKKLWTPEGTKGIGADDRVIDRIGRASWSLSSSPSAPTEAQLRTLAQAEAELAAALDELNRLFEQQVACFRRQVEAAGIELLSPRKPLVLPGRPQRW